MQEPDELREDERVADAAEAEDLAVGLGGDDALQVQRAGLDDHADDGEHQRQLVGDELAGGPQGTEEGVLVGRRPAGHEHADDRERRHGQHVEDAAVRGPRRPGVGAGRDDHEHEERGDEHDDRRQPKMTGRPGPGSMSSFWRNLPTSARSWSEPWGPASIGPRRLCMKLIILNRKTVADDQRAGRRRPSGDEQDLDDGRPASTRASSAAGRSRVIGRCPRG